MDVSTCCVKRAPYPPIEKVFDAVAKQQFVAKTFHRCPESAGGQHIGFQVSALVCLHRNWAGDEEAVTIYLSARMQKKIIEQVAANSPRELIH